MKSGTVIEAVWSMPWRLNSGGGASMQASRKGFSQPSVVWYLLLHVCLWTAIASIGGWSGALHHDMTEAWDWGREFQLGYSKHPPVFAWLSAFWFSVFPHWDVFFYLLSAANAAGGLLGVWMLAGRVMSRAQQTASFILVALLPCFNVLAITYNANAILLLVWPWTIYWFIRSLQTRLLSDSILFGVLSGIALLSKYSSALLLMSCLIAALCHRGRRDYFSSAAPYVSILVSTVVIAPHISWALNHQLTTLTYVLEKQHLTLASEFAVAASTMVGSLLILSIPISVVLASYLAKSTGLWPTSPNAHRVEIQPVLSILALAPFVLTTIAAFVLRIKLSTNFLLPTFFMMPVAAMAASHVPPDLLVRLRGYLAIWSGAAAMAAPVYMLLAFLMQTEQTAEPRREVAMLSTKAWRDTFGTPLNIVAGTEAYSLGIPFYSPDVPHLFILGAPYATPQITPGRIKKSGMLVICESADQLCMDAASLVSKKRIIRRSFGVRRSFLFWRARRRDFELFLVPPESGLTAPPP